VSTLLAEILVLPSSGAVISVLLSCSRNATFLWALCPLQLLLRRPTIFCEPPWPRAAECSCPPPRWGWRCPVLPPPSSRSCCSWQLRPQLSWRRVVAALFFRASSLLGRSARLATLLPVFQHGCSREASWVWPGRSRSCSLGRSQTAVRQSINLWHSDGFQNLARI
jgi:hypothetical protein